MQIIRKVKALEFSKIVNILHGIKNPGHTNNLLFFLTSKITFKLAKFQLK